MYLYLSQHGKCYPSEIDPDRKLTEEGIVESGKAGRILKNKGARVSRVVHSGKTRACETAIIFADYIKPENGVGLMEGMNPNDSVEIFADNISFDDTLYVGHLPFMDKLVSFLVAGNTGAEVLKFSNSCIVCLSKDEKNNSVSVDWIILPDSE